MVSGVLRVTAAAVLAFSTMESAPASAAPDAPLTGLPFLIDAANKVIGPYLPNSAGIFTTLISIDGRIIAAPAGNLGFFEARYTLFYKSKNCTGDAFMNSSTLPIAGMANGTLYYPAAKREEQKIKTGMEFLPNQPASPCFPVQGIGTVSKAQSSKINDLGFVAPFVVKATLP